MNDKKDYNLESLVEELDICELEDRIEFGICSGGSGGGGGVSCPGCEGGRDPVHH